MTGRFRSESGIFILKTENKSFPDYFLMIVLRINIITH